MPINNKTNLRVETNIDGQTVVNEDWSPGFYKRNSQSKSEDAPKWSQAYIENEPEPKAYTRKPSKSKTTPKQDRALTNANKKDLNNRNLK